MSFLTNKRLYFISLLFIFLSAFTLRVYRLDQVPAGMSWDEAAIGYNGFGIWTVHRDEWLHLMPISFQSFGDYKAPFAIYVNGFFTLLFGLNLWAVRLPFVLFGVACIVGISILTNLIIGIFIEQYVNTKTTSEIKKIVVILSTALFAFSPWHLFFSRASFESGMALTLIVWGVVFFLQSFKKTDWQKQLLVFFSVISFVVSLYTYHSAKIFTPLLVVMLLFFFKNQVVQNPKKYLLGFILGMLLMVPVVYDSVWGRGADRLSQTAIFGSTTLTPLQKFTGVFTNYASHFSLPYLISGETTTLRHSDGHWGVLFVTELALICFTLGWMIWKKYFKKTFSTLEQSVMKMIVFGIVWLLIGVVPAAIGFEVPHANRALLSYPGFILIEMSGLFILLFELFSNTQSANKTLILQILIGGGILVHSLLVVSFVKDYFTRYASDSVVAFNWGYKEAFDQVKLKEPLVDKIMFTSQYGQPYIYALFFRHTNPILYNGGSLIKYEFPDKITVGDLMRKNALIVATPEEIDPSQADQLIVAPNGEVRFVIIQTEP